MDHDTFRRLPNLLRKYRRVRGFSQRQVAKVLQIHPGRISKWENGKCLPTLKSVLRLSVVYRVLADALFIDHIRSMRPGILESERKVLGNQSSDKKTEDNRSVV